MLTRRELLGFAGACTLAAGQRFDRSRISAISDEIGTTPEESLLFARQYGLSWLELRSVPGGGGEYAFLPEPEIRKTAAQLAGHGLRVSFLNTGMLKFGLPGTEPVRRRAESGDARATRREREARRFDARLEDLKRACGAAHLLGTDRVRVFTFSRVAEPATLLPRVAEILAGMAEIAARERIHLLVENEVSCNVATCAELAALMELLPSEWIGINWDALNGAAYGEKPFPDGYRLLPRRRIGNVQIKGKSVMDTPQRLDWEAVMRTMHRDGYQGHFGLETHVFDGTLIQASHTSIREILRIAQAVGAEG